MSKVNTKNRIDVKEFYGIKNFNFEDAILTKKQNYIRLDPEVRMKQDVLTITPSTTKFQWTLNREKVKFAMEKITENIDELINFSNVIKYFKMGKIKRYLDLLQKTSVTNMFGASPYLYIGEDILRKEQLDFSLLAPLIKETANKIEYLTPAKAQTGPAKRGDKKTIQTHQGLLTTQQQEVYQLLTSSIQKRNISQDE